MMISSASSTSTSRIALVTGAAGGLGAPFARFLAQQGHRLVLTDRQPCTALADELRGEGHDPIDLPCDLADGTDVQRFAAEVLRRVGRVDVLVNNAAFMPMSPVADLGLAMWNTILAVNVTAPMLLAQAFAPAMAAHGWGRIVNLASSTVWGPPPGMAAYACSKMAVIGLTRALASEFGAQGITVNALSPGLTRHPGSVANVPAEAFEGVRQRQFIPRTEQPQDLLGALGFVVSDGAVFITGQVVNVDGGGFGF